MLVRSRAHAAALVTVAALGIATGRPEAQSAARAGSGITTPKAQFGFDIGADYQLATYRQLAEYWRKLDAESDRLTLVDIGKTAEGRPQLMAIVTAPENQKRLARYQDIARRLTLAEGLTDAQAKALAAEGKAVVWIDGGLHASEVLGAQQLIETSYRLVSGEDEETRRILHDVVIRWSTRTRTATTWSPTGTCATPTRCAARWPACRGSTRSTSATTTTATPTCRPSRRART